MPDNWKKKSVDEKLNDIMDEVTHNSSVMGELDSRFDNVESANEDIEKLLKKIMNEISDLKREVQRLR